ncbi:hypothetical protein QC761_0081100 [Podospora bellae-mahoneyi]|uniref:Uncharacterized protein n=1 Tax=Podospora bellae-mahoneyi TaxID=2093777 RepID=A0ABR0FEB4_9PEZI|nr:hypothetical protein QC761_0081100 [Podospora bellae-mahoneyi]
MVDTNQEGFESLETLDNTQQEDVSNVSDHEHDKIIRPMRALTKQLILQTLSVSILAFHKVSSDVIMSAYLAAPPDISTQKLAGGFGYGDSTIGFILLPHAIMQPSPKYGSCRGLSTRWGHSRHTVSCSAPTRSSTPLHYFCLGLSVTSSILALILVVLELWFNVVLPSIGYICSTIFAAASFCCLARSVGPLVTGKVYEVGDRIGYAGLAFWVLAAVAVAGGVESFWLRDQV